MKKAKFTKHTRKHARKHARKHTKRNTKKDKNKKRSFRKFGGYQVFNGPYDNVIPELKEYIDERVRYEPEGERKKQELLDNLHRMHFDPNYVYLRPPRDGNTPLNQGISHIETYLIDGVGWW